MVDHLATIWEAIADRMPGEVALVHGGQRRTWGEFEERSARLASALLAAGVRPGETVAIDMFNASEYFEVFFAALKIRAVPANVNHRYLGQELADLLRKVDAVALVYHAGLRERVAPALAEATGLRLVAEVADGDPGEAGPWVSYEGLIGSAQPAARMHRPETDTFLSLTGGTTGLPKGVEYVIGHAVRNTRMLGRQMLGLDDVDWDGTALERAVALHAQGRRPVALPASPLMHSTGLIMASLPVLTAGGTVVTLTGRRFDPFELLAAIASTRPRTVSIVGNAFARPLAHALDAAAADDRPYDTASLVTITSAGMAWSADAKLAILEHIPQVTLVDACGSSEGVTIGSMITRRGQAATTDRFVPPPGLMLVRPEGTVIDPTSTEHGMFLAPTPAHGYRNDPEGTAAVFRAIGTDTYALTGDWGHWNPDGTVTLLGRGTSTINTGGEKVFAEEVENVVRSVPGIDDCVVLGVPDDRFGQQVAAIVQPASDLVSPDAVRSAARARLAGYKVPRIVISAQVPRGPNGKIIYPEARRLVEEQGRLMSQDRS
jgi:3-oxocholest-4-en-26-oate---CoA ligase